MSWRHPAATHSLRAAPRARRPGRRYPGGIGIVRRRAGRRAQRPVVGCRVPPVLCRGRPVRCDFADVIGERLPPRLRDPQHRPTPSTTRSTVVALPAHSRTVQRPASHAHSQCAVASRQRTIGWTCMVSTWMALPSDAGVPAKMGPATVVHDCCPPLPSGPAARRRIVQLRSFRPFRLDHREHVRRSRMDFALHELVSARKEVNHAAALADASRTPLPAAPCALTATRRCATAFAQIPVRARRRVRCAPFGSSGSKRNTGHHV